MVDVHAMSYTTLCLIHYDGAGPCEHIALNGCLELCMCCPDGHRFKIVYLIYMYVENLSPRPDVQGD